LLTEYIKIDCNNPEPELIQQAASLIRRGELVAFPTETVYGLGASAFVPEAVEKIFIAKSRPAGNPLLLHVSNREHLSALVSDISLDALLLMETFWPGPLSIILPALPGVPRVITGGQPGVGLRMPDHPIALALIEAAGPIAAPSANLSGRPSPLTAADVAADLDGRIAAVVDGGSTGLGVESTVIDLSGPHYRLIRLGGVPVERLQDILQCNIELIENENTRLPHYQTQSKVILCENEEDFIEKLAYYRGQGGKAAVVNNSSCGIRTTGDIGHYYLELDSGSSLYSILRKAEQDGIEILLFAPLTVTDGLGAAVVDRIRRSARRSEG